VTVRLRAHHLLCLLAYAGKGYSPAFTANYDRLAARIAAGEAVEIVSGPDDICAPLLDGDAPHCRLDRVMRRDRLAAEAVAGLLSRSIAPGTVLDFDAHTIASLRVAFANGTARAACAGCEWFDLCTVIASNGYRDTRIGSKTASTTAPSPRSRHRRHKASGR